MRRGKERRNKRTRAAEKRKRGGYATEKTRPVLMLHASNRARMRYEVLLLDSDIEAMNQKIQRNEARFVSTQSTSRTRWLVEHEGRVYAAVYNKNLNCIATFLPESIVHTWEAAIEGS